MIVFGFAAMTVIVLFFGIAVANMMGAFVEKDSDRIIHKAQAKNTEGSYGAKDQHISQPIRPSPIRPSLPPYRTQPRTFVNKRDMAPGRTRKT